MFQHIVTYDIDYYLLKFLFITDIANLKLVNHQLNKLVATTKIYQQMKQLIGISISKNEKIMEKCYEQGLLKILKNYHQNKKNIIIPSSIGLTSEYGHIAVLDWFKNSRFEFKYNECAISSASKNGHIAVLDWFKNSGFEFKYSEWAIIYASQNGHIAVLDWFKNSGFEFKYDEHAINYASANGHTAVLNWFKYSGFKIEYDECVINCALFNGHTAVLDWLKNSGLEFKE